MDAQEEFFSLEHSRLLNIAWWAKNLALVMLIINVLLAGAKFVELQNTETYRAIISNQVPIIYLISFIVAGLSAAVAIAVVYFPLKALSQILRILMEREFRIRKAN